MRTNHHSVSSAQRFSAWFVAALGLAAYVGLIYGLTVFPVQFELPVPHWATFVVPAVTYGVLVLLFIRRPSVHRWIVGTAVLTGLHVLLGIAREPLTTMLDPALSGRPLPWTLPPPFPELVGVFLLLVPLRDVLRARPRLARDRTSGGVRSSPHARTRRAAVAPRVPQAALGEGLESAKETSIQERSIPAEPLEIPAASPSPAPMAPPAPAEMPAPLGESRRRRSVVQAESRPETPRRPPRRTDVVLRIALDRIMGQLPPGTFLAPEDEVAASLRDPGHLLIPGDLVVTQLSEGVARIAWSDIADQFPSHLVGLSREEISEHLSEGLRLPLDEVVGQLPHELFVADTPEVEMAGLDRIPVPFQPMEDSTPAPSLSQVVVSPEIRPAPPVEQPRPAPTPTAPQAPPAAAVAPPVVEARPVVPVTAVPVMPAPLTPPRVDVPAPSVPAPVQAPPPSVAAPAASSRAADGPTVRISFARVASEIPTDAFNVPIDQVAQRMREPGALLVPQSLVLSQLADGLVRVKWDVVASQFPREMLIVSDADMMARLPNGISLPLDEVIRQIPPDLFAIGGRAVDLHGLESFPAPFQPLVSDPGPPTPKAADSAPPVEPLPALAVAEPQVVAEPAIAAPPPLPEVPVVATGTPAVVVEEPPVPEPSAREPRASQPIAAELPRTDGPTVPTAPLVTPQPTPEPLSVPSPEWPEPAASEPEGAPKAAAPIVAMAPEPLAVTTPPPAEIEIARVERSGRDVEPPTPTVVAAPSGMAETAEARRIVAMLAPIASFDVSVQSVEGVTVFAMAAPSVAQEIAVAGAGLAMSLFTDRRAPWSLDQITFRGPDTALVLTALGSPSDRGSVLATAVARGGGLALLEILCRRAAGDRSSGTVPTLTPDGPPPGRGLVSSSSERLAGLTSSLTAFGDVRASTLRDAGGEGLLYLFLPGTADVPGVGAIAQDVQAVMGKAAGSGAVFHTAVVRSGSTVLVIQPEEVGHGRSLIVVAGGEVTRPGLAYRQVERVTTALAQA